MSGTNTFIKLAENASANGWCTDFTPRRLLRNGHLMTLAGNFLPRPHGPLPEPEAILVKVQDPIPGYEEYGPSSVLCHVNWQPEQVRSQRLTVLLVHGLEGSSASQYMLGNALRAWKAGCNVVRMNMRSCGATDRLSPAIYHSGCWQDVARVVEHIVQQHHLHAVALIGYSMGGNLVLNYAGQFGNRVPPYLKAAIGISPLMDLAVSSSALHEPQNRVYEQYFLRSMLARIRRKADLFPRLYLSLCTNRILQKIHSMRDFDEYVVAPFGGFASADDYYDAVASSHVAAQLGLPVLIVHSLDDPFIRMRPETREALLNNPHVSFIETGHGGHCAFLAPGLGDDGYWAEKTLFGFLLATTGTVANGS